MRPSDHFRVNRPNVTSETIDGEVVILNLDRGRYYSLGGCGSRAWSAIESRASVAQIVDDVVAGYDGERGEMESAVLGLLEELRREELIVEVSPSDEAAPGARVSVNGNGAPAVRGPFSAPVLQVYTDMEDLLLLDPIHEVDESGWPHPK